MGRIAEAWHLARRASHHYRRPLAVLLIKVLWLRFRHGHMLKGLPATNLLAKDPGEFVIGLRVSSRRVRRWQRSVNPLNLLASVNDKPRLYATCQEAGIPVPCTHATGRPGMELLARLPNRFLVKPVFGGGGFGVSAFERAGTGFREWNGTNYAPEGLVDRLLHSTGGRELLFQDWLATHASLKGISNSALMTVRIATLYSHSESYPPEILFSYLRVLRPGSITDNVGSDSTGVQWVEIDAANGRAVRAWTLGSAGFGMVPIDQVRGENPVPVEDLAVPAWEEILRIVDRACRLFPGVRTIGWDIGIAEEGPVIIEGNTDWGIPDFPRALRSIDRAMHSSA